MTGMIMNQFGGGEWWSWIIWILFMMVFFMFYPKLMVTQIMWKLEGAVRKLELLSLESKKFIYKEITKKPKKIVKDAIDRFFEFFVIGPVSLDPFGIVKKLDHLVRNEKERFTYFVNQTAPKFDEEKKACIQMGLAGGIELHMIAKIVRHYVELVRKTKSYQLAFIIDMQLPLIERIAKAIFEGTKALTKGNPIGDGAAPLIIANLMGKEKTKEIEEDILLAKTKIKNREIFLLKAKGPGGRIGYPGKAVEKIVKTNRITRIITIDAAAKLEGEKTGSVAEGVGVAMGGVGTERSYIEDIAVKQNMPLDSIIIKMSAEEAIQPMRKVIKDAFPKVQEAIFRSLEHTKPKDKVIIAGIGNTSGIGNSALTVKDTEKWVEKYERELKERVKKKKRWF